MSWSDEKRCLHCGTRIPLHRKVVDEQFCSDEHKRIFRLEQDQLAVAMLHQSGQFMAASSGAQYGQPDGDDDSHVADSVALATYPGGFGPGGFVDDGAPRFAAEEPVFDPDRFNPDRFNEDTLPAPHALASLNTSPISRETAHEFLSNRQEPELVNEFFATLSPAEPGVTHVLLSGQNFNWLETEELFISLCSLPVAASGNGAPRSDGDTLFALLPHAASEAKPAPGAGYQDQWLEPESQVWNLIAPVFACPLDSGLPGSQTQGGVAFGGLTGGGLAGPCDLSLPGPKGLPAAGIRGELSPEAPTELLLALDSLVLSMDVGPALASKVNLGITGGANASPESAVEAAAGGPIRPFVQEEAALFSPVVAMPEQAFVLASGAGQTRLFALRWPMKRAEMRIVPTVSETAAVSGPFSSNVFESVAQPLHKLTTSCPEAEKNRLQGALAFWAASRDSAGGNPLRLVSDFWQNAPRDLKLLAIAIPLLLALVFHPSLPRIHFTTKSSAGRASQSARAETLVAAGSTAPLSSVTSEGNGTLRVLGKNASQVPTVSVALATNEASPALADSAASKLPLPKLPLTKTGATDDSRNAGSNAGSWSTGLLSHFAGLQQTLAERAGVELDEDFRSGLDDWQTESNPAAAWSFDQTGFVRPTSLGLYRPSLALKDYEMQFLGMIDNKALNWVVRARDFRNYYAVKLVVLKGGPTPIIGLDRYPVIDGKAGKHVQTPVRVNVQKDTLYRVGMTVHDDIFLVTVQGAVVDSWSDAGLNRGGIGFFSGAGEASRLRWVQVSHQYDILGRLCAYLAPIGSQANN